MKIGALTIGQSPRNDLIPEIEAFFKGAEIIQLGALDGLSKEQIADLAPSGDDEILVSKLKDDSWALMAESKIISLLQERTDELCRRGVSLIVLLCTGMFSKELVASVPVIYPQKLLYSIVPILAGGRKLGIISPDPKQTEQNYERWQKVSDNIVVAALNPYDKSNAPGKAAQYLKENGAEVVVLDCMGFTIAIKEKMAELMGVPVILPRTLVARVVGEML